MDLGRLLTPAESSCVLLPPAPMSHCNHLVCSSSSRQSCKLPGTDGDHSSLLLQPTKATAAQPTRLEFPKIVLLSFSRQDLPVFNPSGPQGRLSPLEKVLAEAEHAALAKICPLKPALQWLESILTQPQPG